MADGRKNNGGNSTKAVREDDKRLNHAKRFLKQYVSNDFSYDKFKELLNSLYDKGFNGDVKAATLFLQYTVGKPTEYVDITSGDEPIGNDIDYSKLSTQALLEIAKLKS